jgi:uncharacterized protein YbjT (DUF2867 family)
MKVALDGPTGFIRSHVLTALREHGHEVIALVHDDAQAEIVAARGVAPVVIDLYDRAAVASVLRGADGAIHTASPGDATSADLDSAVADAAIDAFAGTGKQISGLAVVAAGAPGAVPGSDDEARARLGDDFAEVLPQDQGTDAPRARAELGWAPTHPGLADEFREGSYRKATSG